MKRSLISERNVSITIPADRVVVAGRALGRASRVALHRLVPRFGLWAEMRRKEISQENKLGAAPEHHFIRADLGLFAEAERVAHDIRTRAGPRGIDYLLMCQGAPPNGMYVLPSEGIGQHFAVQVLSRFVLGYALTVDAGPAVKKGS
ncbi:hypothetical protein JB92DRAFT_2826780 [Gautieria morchelliformis]|nr:hypothetical protein JB92DRAFT_2826780 [Gautieria morchelliformis]